MAPSKAPTSWDDEDSDSSPSSPQAVPVARRGKFDDEEDSDVLESWDAAEDSEEEREKAKKAAEAKAKADAAAKANHKSKSQRIEEKRQENMRKRLELEESSDEDEDEADKRARLRASEKEADLQNAEDLFAGVGGVSNARAGPKPVTVQQGEDPADIVDLSKLKLFNPSSAAQFSQLRETLVPLLTANSKKPLYASFMQEFSKQLVKELSSEQVKKISSGLSTISNEKMAAEKAAEKGGKKTKAVKTKVALSATRDVSHKADVTNYDDGLDDDDFM